MNQAEQLALRVIEEGEPFEDSWHDEGDVESGPMGGRIFGYRFEDTVLELTRNGSVYLYNAEGDQSGTMIYRSSPVGVTSYTGIGAMIKDHLHAVESNASRNGLEFVKTGRRPAEGRYSLGEIVKREEAMRTMREPTLAEAIDAAISKAEALENEDFVSRLRLTNTLRQALRIEHGEERRGS